MRFRLHNWLNTDTGQPRFGIQTWDVKGKKWRRCYEGTTPLIFDSKDDAEAKLATLN